MVQLILFLLHLFQPSPPIIVGRDTTYITEPLTADGLPDYEAYLRDLGRKDVTPDNNAAVLVWQALWPNNLEREYLESMRAELGLKDLPSAKAALQLVDGDANQKRIIEWLHSNADEVDPKEVTRSAAHHVWTSKQCPPLADWVAANKRPLDLLVEACAGRGFIRRRPAT